MQIPRNNNAADAISKLIDYDDWQTRVKFFQKLSEIWAKQWKHKSRKIQFEVLVFRYIWCKCIYRFMVRPKQLLSSSNKLNPSSYSAHKTKQFYRCFSFTVLAVCCLLAFNSNIKSELLTFRYWLRIFDNPRHWFK